MSIYHCSVKTISRSAGRSAPAAAAYRAGVCLADERTGEVHNYTRKRGIVHTELIFPSGVNMSRAQLWNTAESSENRKNSTVAREYELALPNELTPDQQKELVKGFALHLSERYGVAADIAIHAPGKDGDRRNHHAHVLTTTRQVTPEGFGAKTRVLDDKKTGEVEHVRATWATMTNHVLERAGHQERVSHKSLKAQGIEREPTSHLGPVATAMERRGERSERGDLNRGPVENRAAQAELASAEKVQTGVDKMRAQAREWCIAQEQIRQQALAAERAKRLERERLEQDIKERQAQQEAERKAQEKERLAREQAERRKKNQGRGLSLGR